MSELSDRRARAALRREIAVLNRTQLGGVERDFQPVMGPEALSLVTRLTQESWATAGREFPRYERSQIPVRFVPTHPK